jgi:hypothetical protein
MWEIDILEYVEENPILFYFFTHRDSHGNTINKKKTGVRDIEEDIISMLWIGLKIK